MAQLERCCNCLSTLIAKDIKRLQGSSGVIPLWWQTCYGILFGHPSSHWPSRTYIRAAGPLGLASQTAAGLGHRRKASNSFVRIEKQNREHLKQSHIGENFAAVMFQRFPGFPLAPPGNIHSPRSCACAQGACGGSEAATWST